MTSSSPISFDPKQYKTTQRQGWDSVATGWQKWWKNFEGGAQKLSDRLVELAEIGPGQQVLDVATGIGEPATTAAKKVGANGRVLATDISPQMLSIAEKRAFNSLDKLQNIVEFKEVDAEEMFDLPASSFDAVLCRWGLMLLPNVVVALDSIHRLLVPNRRLVAAVWAEPSKVPLLSLAFGIVREELQLPPPPPGSPGAFSLADLNILESYLTQTGFTDVHSERLTLTFEFASAEEYTQFHKDVSPPIHAMLANQTQERKEEIWKVVTEEARRQYTEKDTGSLKMDNDVICVVGTS
jgi:ubiquinone/menaquinone biosynthesis C-methylase UbiE